MVQVALVASLAALYPPLLPYRGGGLSVDPYNRIADLGVREDKGTFDPVSDIFCNASCVVEAAQLDLVKVPVFCHEPAGLAFVMDIFFHVLKECIPLLAILTEIFIRCHVLFVPIGMCHDKYLICPAVVE